MTIDDVKQIIAKQESLGLTRATLKINKSKTFKQKSDKIKTPFGMALAHFNGINKDGTHCYIVHCEISGMKKWVEKIEGAK